MRQVGPGLAEISGNRVPFGIVISHIYCMEVLELCLGLDKPLENKNKTPKSRRHGAPPPIENTVFELTVMSPSFYPAFHIFNFLIMTNQSITEISNNNEKKKSQLKKLA